MNTALIASLSFLFIFFSTVTFGILYMIKIAEKEKLARKLIDKKVDDAPG